MVGRQSYSNITARDNWITAFFTYGEGFHNFHHQFPLDYRNGVRAYHYDPTKWLIYGLYRLGLVSDLRRISVDRIVRYRLRMDEQRVTFAEHMAQVVSPLREKIHHVLARIEELEKARKSACRAKSREYRKLLRVERNVLKRYMNIWARLVREQRRLDLAMQM